MRISNLMRTSNQMLTLERRSDAYYKANTVLSTGQTVNKASDDPVQAARIVRLNGAIERNMQYQRNVDSARTYLSHTELSLRKMDEHLQDARSLAVQGDSDTYTAHEREMLAVEVNNHLEELFAEGNRKFLGRHLYSGTNTESAAFLAIRDVDGNITSVSANPEGTDGTINVQVTENESIQVNLGGEDVMFSGRASSEGDIFAAMIALRDALKSDDMDTIGESITRIDAALDNIDSQRAVIGVRVQYVDETMDRLYARDETLSDDIGLARDADIAQATMDFSVAEAGYQAALAATSRTLELTLLSFLE